MTPMDPVALAQALIRCRSVTPADAGTLSVLEGALKPLGFTCERMRFEADGTAAVDNLYARFGSEPPHFCFAGHTDVVPPGDSAAWRHDPFAAVISGDVLHGRGAADMKSAVAAFAAAAALKIAKGTLKGSISFLITGDEEGDATCGTKPMLERLADRNERIDHCLVGEPTATATAGDTIKIGRRGSMTVELTVHGIQGHTAYPQRALNPIPVLAAIVTRLAEEPLDSGSVHFEPSTVAFTTFDVGNPASNVSPAAARTVCNIRFNDLHTTASLLRRFETIANTMASDKGCKLEIKSKSSGNAFVTQPGPFTDLLSRAIETVSGEKPRFSTTGGTSDARFIKSYCPVAEVGLPGATMHKVDECMPLAEIERLTRIYAAVLDAYFAHPLQ
jgi:succinyl-diaminopimelate desuccinylase